MQYGLSIPNFGDSFQPRALATLAHEAEAAGWDGFFLWDHVMFGQYPTADLWIALAAIALQTERIKIGPLVTPLPRRRPVKLARETVTLDHLSNGRLILGVGSGGHPWEWEQLGEAGDHKTRGAMLDEGLDLLTQLWSGEPVSYHGKYYTVQAQLPGDSGPARFLPRPVQTPRIPIWVAGTWPNKPPFRRAARWEGVFPILASSDMSPESGLQPADMRAIIAYTSTYRHSDAPLDVVIAGVTPSDDHARAAAKVAPYIDAGCTWWIEDISPWAYGWNWQGDWPVAAIQERIRQGPPRVS